MTNNIHKTIIVLYTNTLYGVNSNNIYQKISTLMDHNSAAIMSEPQYLLNDNFLKSMLHNIKINQAMIVKINELKLLSVNNRNQNTTVNIVSNSPYGKRVESFSFL
jgi:hypothetical protein